MDENIYPYHCRIIKVMFFNSVLSFASNLVGKVNFKIMAVSSLNFGALRAYTDEELQLAFQRLLKDPSFIASFRHYFPDLPVDIWLNQIENITSIREFQSRWVGPAIDSLVRKTFDKLTVGGFENLSHEKKYLFIANHHDILLDASLLSNESIHHGFETPMVCFGDNLLVQPLIYDLVKMNKGLTVKRGAGVRDLFQWSVALSQTIRDSIEKKQNSVWIAQREGRTKDGNDRTQPGLIKMLALSGETEFIERLQSLNPVPVSTSYEYNPCAIWKARETYFTRRHGTYAKHPNEDLNSMSEGLTANKGRVHLQIGHELGDALSHFPYRSKKQQAEEVAALVDCHIWKNFRLWPSHYAADAILRKDKIPRHGNPDDLKVFTEYMEKEFSRLKSEERNLAELRQCFLELYANPVRNKLRASGPEKVLPGE